MANENIFTTLGASNHAKEVGIDFLKYAGGGTAI